MAEMARKRRHVTANMAAGRKSNIYGARVIYFYFIYNFFGAVVRELTPIAAFTGPLQLGPAAAGSGWTHSMAEFNSINRCYAFEVETHIMYKKGKKLLNKG